MKINKRYNYCIARHFLFSITSTTFLSARKNPTRYISWIKKIKSSKFKVKKINKNKNLWNKRKKKKIKKIMFIFIFFNLHSHGLSVTRHFHLYLILLPVLIQFSFKFYFNFRSLFRRQTINISVVSLYCGSFLLL